MCLYIFTTIVSYYIDITMASWSSGQAMKPKPVLAENDLSTGPLGSGIHQGGQNQQLLQAVAGCEKLWQATYWWFHRFT